MVKDEEVFSVETELTRECFGFFPGFCLGLSDSVLFSIFLKEKILISNNLIINLSLKIHYLVFLLNFLFYFEE